MPRFVLLKHELPASAPRGSHFDLMLETDDGLLTFELQSLPAGEEEQLVQELPLHRAHYLDYEGPISGNRGQVTRLEHGTFIWLVREPGLFQAELVGEQIRGVLNLTCVNAELHSWRLRFSAPGSSSAGSSLPG